MPDTDDLRPRVLLQWPTYAMGRLHRRGLAAIEAGMSSAGVSLRDHAVLASVAEAEGPSQQQVAESLGIDPSDMVKILDRLESRGLVQRRRSPVDRRRYELALTARGRETLEAVQALASQATSKVLVRLTSDEQRSLARLLLKALGE